MSWNVRERLSILRPLHWILAQGLVRAGYRWEPRRQGELQIGLWRKNWVRTRNPRRLVLIPGFGDTPMSWLLVLGLLRPALRRDFDEVVLVDFPGYGGFLAKERPFHSLDLLQESLFDALDTLKPDTVLGHSLGGYLAAAYAVECGEGTHPRAQFAGAKSAYKGPRHLILVDPTGVFADQCQRDELERIYRKALTDEINGISHLRPHIFAREPFWFRFLVAEFKEFFRTEEISQFVDSVAATHDLTARVHQIRSKVWLVWGEKDSLIPASCLSAWLSNLNYADSGRPPAQAVLLKNAGHSPQVEAPTALSTVLNQILAETHGRGAPLLDFQALGRWFSRV